MDHHVLHVAREHRVTVLVDLTSAPGRTVVFTRTKHGAKALARQLNKSGVPAVELHGNLSQNARTRNMDAFHSGKATTLVATDIAARGIHVDDVALVVHADPPVEHKAYLHRSGRTARAGTKGTVVTLMTDEQVRDVRDLTRAAGIKPTTTKFNGSSHAILAELAPGTRVLVPGGLVVEVPEGTQRAPRPQGPVAAVAAVATARAVAAAARRRSPTAARPARLEQPAKSGGNGQRRSAGKSGRRPRPAASPATAPRRSAPDGADRSHLRGGCRSVGTRQLVAAAFVVLGGVLLGLSLRIEPGGWFYAASLGLSAVWVVGALAVGPPRIGPPRPVLLPIVAAVGLLALFVLGGLVVREVPFLADQVADVAE